MHVELHPDYRARPAAQEARDLISACVHCGFCLATCPTYLESGDERDSPRGRIYLLKQLLETGSASGRTHTHLDRCLTCRNCETTCPSGVHYGQLVDIGRGLMEERVPRSPLDRGRRWLLRTVLPRRHLFTPLLRLGQLLRPLLPPTWRSTVPPRQAVGPLPPLVHARTMLVLDGCVQAAATPGTNAAARRVLDRLGINLVTVPQAGCCGAVNYHLAAHSRGLDEMRRNIDAWWPRIEAGAEAIIATATGCGSMLAEYGKLLAHDPAYAEKAQRVSALARDIGEILLQEELGGLRPDTGIGRVAVHTPCSLQHARKLPGLIREVLQKTGFELAETAENHLCCGSAGTYSILQVTAARRLRDRKLQALTGDRPDLIATGNVGCQLHLQGAATIPVVHWIELIDPSRGQGPPPDGTAPDQSH